MTSEQRANGLTRHSPLAPGFQNRQWVTEYSFCLCMFAETIPGAARYGLGRISGFVIRPVTALLVFPAASRSCTVTVIAAVK